MIVDPKTYSESVNRSLHTENKKTVMDYVAAQETNASIFGASTESYSVAKVSENGIVKAGEATYGKPAKHSAVEDLMEDNAKGEELHKNEMVVISQTTSPEDYEKLQEEGYSITDTGSHTIVTVMDKIKAVLAQSGDTTVDLSQEQLEEITGSVAMATKIKKVLDEAKAYLLKNDLDPSIENLYKANFSGQNMSKGSISDSDFEAISTQLKGILEDSNIPVDNHTLEEARWLINYGLPVNRDNMNYLEDLNAFATRLEEQPLSEEEIESLIKEGLSEGVLPKDTMLIEGYSIADQAENAYTVIQNVTDEALAYCVEKGQELTIDNLANAMDKISSGEKAGVASEARLATARRQLEEVRLVMTVEANQALLKRGIQIDTAPIEELVTQLKDVENMYYKTLLESEGVEASSKNVDTLKNSIQYVEELKTAPAYFIDKLTSQDTLDTFHEEGMSLRAKMDQAKDSYETLMTSPRKDMGDSIQKAFRNVDDILDDLGMDRTKSNERAVRILAYNQTEINEENLQKVKTTDEQVQQAFKNLTPKVTLEMIRRGMNPLDMSMEELNQVAVSIKEEIGVEDAEKFSKFLYRLDQKKEISKEERDSYIGIYRLIAQVEKTDGAVIGSLMNQGADLTMKNLLTAVRNGKKSGMEYKIDDDFDGLNSTSTGVRIDDQIMASYQSQCAKDAMDMLTPQVLENIPEESLMGMTPEELKAAIEEQSLMEEEVAADKAFIKEQLSEVQEAAQASEEFYAFLDKFDVPSSATNVLASMRMMNNSNEMFQRLFKETPSNRELIHQWKDEILERFGEAVSSPTDLAEAQEALEEVATRVMKTMIIEDPDTDNLDIRQMKLVTAGLKICSKQAQDESYMVPVETTEGICGVAVRVVRDEDKKGTVDISFRGEFAGKIAASFEAKADRISGTIAVSDENTRNMISEQLGLLATLMNEGVSEEEREAVDLQVAYLPDMSLEKFQMHSAMKESIGDSGNVVQTRRLYHIAESFIQTIQELMSDQLF